VSPTNKERVRILDKLERVWANCDDCALCMTRKKIVYWRGNPDAKLCVIGEAPGADEDEQGQPFVGAAGKMLDKLFKLAGLSSREDAFIINVLGCRPPGNRKPQVEEMAACKPRLEAMLWANQPGAILLLGASSARLAGIHQIAAWRGRVTNVTMKLLEKHVIEYDAVATFHPSYINRLGGDASLMQLVATDIKLAYRLANGKD
jgi:uracil-DNA glycosylase